MVMLVLLALVPEGAEGHSWSVQPRQLMEKPPDRLTPHAPKLHHFVEGLVCDYGSRTADKIEELLQHLETEDQVRWKGNKLVLGQQN